MSGGCLPHNSLLFFFFFLDTFSLDLCGFGASPTQPRFSWYGGFAQLHPFYSVKRFFILGLGFIVVLFLSRWFFHFSMTLLRMTGCIVVVIDIPLLPLPSLPSFSRFITSLSYLAYVYPTYLSL